MLYDDEDQMEVRYVIALEQYDIDIYGSEENILEGELFVKRNCIRLRRRKTVDDLSTDSKPFFLYCDNCSQKEDFYHAMVHAQQPHPVPLQFEHDHIVKLVRLLHSSEDTVQTRWLNALLGRLFLSLYKTTELPAFISSKIAKKISRVQKPAFIERTELRKIDLGDSAPLVTNPKLKELNLDGDVTLEADIKYYGNFRLEISAVAKIDLGQRFKPREVTLMLAAILKSLEGHVLFRIKPPPSNRIWFSFETMPKLDLVIEPVVSTRQITYGIILRAIESRIREVIGDSLVQPYWDDVGFLPTNTHPRRGGLWADTLSDSLAAEHPTDQTLSGVPSDQVSEPNEISNEDDAVALPYAELISGEKTMSMPILPANAEFESHSRKSSRDSTPARNGRTFFNSAGTRSAGRPSVKPRESNRSKSYASSTKSTTTDDTVMTGDSINGHHSGDLLIATPPELSQESESAEELLESNGNGSKSTIPNQPESQTSLSLPSEMEDSATRIDQQDDTARGASSSGLPSRSLSGQSNLHSDKASTRSSGSVKRQTLATTAASATATAAKWGYDMLQRRKAAAAAARAQRQASLSQADLANETLSNENFPSSTTSIDESPVQAEPSQPMGRGQPLPPPGQPLPGPRQARRQWNVAPFGGMTKRKPVPSRSGSVQTTDSTGVSSGVQSPSVSQLHVHRRQESGDSALSANDSQLVQTVEDAAVNDDSLISLEDPDLQVDSLPPPLPPRAPEMDHEDEHAEQPSGKDVPEQKEDVPQYSELSVVEEPTSIETRPENVGTLGTTAETDFGDWEENAPESPVVGEEHDEDEQHENHTTQHIFELSHEDDQETYESKDVVQISSQNDASSPSVDVSGAEREDYHDGKREIPEHTSDEDGVKTTPEAEALKMDPEEKSLKVPSEHEGPKAPSVEESVAPASLEE